MSGVVLEQRHPQGHYILWRYTSLKKTVFTITTSKGID
jgi:hypothetical protein